jgi:Zn-dependent M28 family amino/carboxypeptidase
VPENFSPDSLLQIINAELDSVSKPLLVIIPSKYKSWITRLKAKQFSKPNHSLLIISIDEINPIVSVSINEEARNSMLFNVIGVVPGKTLPNEIVLISAHYDHVGLNIHGSDKVYNGANDNASGTAAMLSMARYFSGLQNNQRTIVFVAFAGEELGLLGSQHLASLVKPETIIAMINLEMLGKPNVLGKKSLLITGTGYSGLERIMRKYCKSIKINSDNNIEEKLFARSDHYPFALKGVPANTFMCFTPGDKDYHQPSDEISKIDFSNFSHLVEGLLPGIEAIISGKEKPKRIR